MCSPSRGHPKTTSTTKENCTLAASIEQRKRTLHSKKTTENNHHENGAQATSIQRRKHAARLRTQGNKWHKRGALTTSIAHRSIVSARKTKRSRKPIQQRRCAVHPRNAKVAHKQISRKQCTTDADTTTNNMLGTRRDSDVQHSKGHVVGHDRRR